MLTAAAAAALDRELLSSGWLLPQLMELAGLAVSHALHRSFPPSTHPRLLCVVGPGNNGGDALVAARHATSLGYGPVTVVVPRVGAASAHLIAQCQDFGVRLETAVPSADTVRNSFDVAIDGLFGFSFRPSDVPRPPFDTALALLSSLSERQPLAGGRPGASVLRTDGVRGIPILSIDIPSAWPVDGWDTDASSWVEPFPPLLRPSALISLTAPKPCSAVFDGGHHWLVGRGFMSPSIAAQYGLEALPPYPHADLIVAA